MNIDSTSEIEMLINDHTPVAFGVSGGKDSIAAALSTFQYLDSRGHKGTRVLIHSDLGSVEWKESLPKCQELADHLNCELIVVKRKSGDLMDRWESRWASSLRRYINLETVTLVLPWSTPSMRFCTSELKTQIIEAELKRRFKGQVFINVTGVRRDESTARAKGTIASPIKDSRAWSWRPISNWSKSDVFDQIYASGLLPHKAYTDFKMSRVSCMFCIMSNWNDLLAAALQEESHELYRRMVNLEVISTFGFQGNRWLADVAPHLLDDKTQKAVAESKQKAVMRVNLEKSITKEMLYQKGWPVKMLTDEEATILAQVRTQIGNLLGIEVKYTTMDEVHGRYAQLISIKEEKDHKKLEATNRKVSRLVA